jgi:hypothetical protein
VGTGFTVVARSNAAVGISAGHVFSGVQLIQHGRHRGAHPSTPKEFAPRPKAIDIELKRLLLVSKVGNSPIICKVVGLAFDESSDFGAVQFEPQQHEASFSLRNAILDDRCPGVGDMVCMLSYADLSCTNVGNNSFSLRRRAVLRIGRVLQVFPDGQRLCRGPCIETSIPMYSGMSGGPVFHYSSTGNMRAVGLVCSDPDGDGPQNQDRSRSGRSIVALLPLRRLSGSVDGLQEVALRFRTTSRAGMFSRFDGFDFDDSPNHT